MKAAKLLPFLMHLSWIFATKGASYEAGLIIDGEKFCGGALISNQFVITTANCVTDAFEVDVVLGVDKLTQTTKTAFISTQFYADNVALIKIPTVDLSKYNLKSLDLPSRSCIQEHSEFKLSGFNLSGELGSLELQIGGHKCENCNHEAFVAANETGNFQYANVGSAVTSAGATGEVLVGIAEVVSDSVVCAVEICPLLEWIANITTGVFV